MKNCTFLPNTDSTVNTSIVPKREDPYLYDRLSKSTKKVPVEVLQTMREVEELKQCTFKPETNKKSTDLMSDAKRDEYVDR